MQNYMRFAHVYVFTAASIGTAKNITSISVVHVYETHLLNYRGEFIATEVLFQQQNTRPYCDKSNFRPAT